MKTSHKRAARVSLKSATRRTEIQAAIIQSAAERTNCYDRKFDPADTSFAPKPKNGTTRGIKNDDWNLIEQRIKRRDALRHVQRCVKSGCLYCERSWELIEPLLHQHEDPIIRVTV